MINKNRYSLVLAVLICLAMSLSACSSKQEPINNLANLTEEVQSNGAYYSEDEWNSVTEELGVIESELEQYKNEYTNEELREIGRLKGILLAQYTKYYVRSITSGVEDAMKEVEGLFDGFLDGFSKGASE